MAQAVTPPWQTLPRERNRRRRVAIMSDARPSRPGARAAPSLQGWAETGDGVVLLGVECGSCGAVRLPYQDFGCEVCGATGPDLRQVELPAVGRLRDAASVHRHPSRPVPFTLGDIELEGGPVVLALLSTAEQWLPGSMVEAVSTTPDEQRLPVFSLKKAR